MHSKTCSVIGGSPVPIKMLGPHQDHVSLEGTGTVVEALKLVYEGKVDCMIGTSLHNYHIAENQLLGLAPAYIKMDQPIHAVTGVRNDWPELIGIINKGLKSISIEERNEIYAKWIQIPPQKEYVEFTAEEKTWLSKNYTVRVRIGDQAPYAYSGDGKPVGIAVDLLRAISEHTGINFHFVIPSPSFSVDLQGLIQQTGPDFMGSLTPTSEREKKILFTKPYVSSPKFIFTRDEAEFVASMEHLSDKTVAVIKDYLVHKELAEKYPDINLLFFKNNKDALTAVSSGKAFSFIGGLLSTPLMINEFGLKNLKAAAPSSLQDATVAMAIRNDWPELRDIINKVLDAMPGDEKAAIINKWSAVKIEYGIRPADILKWFAVLASGTISIVLLFVYLNRSLAKKIRERTFELESSNKSLAVEVAERTNAEKSLRNAHDYLKNLTNSLPDAVFSVDIPKRKIEWANDTFKVLGYEPDECIGRTTKFLYPTEEDYLAFGEKLDGAIAEGKEVLHTELLLRKKSGDVFPAEVTTSFFRTGGELVSVTSTVRDISKRKQKEQRLQEYQQRLKALASQLTIAEENERRRIAADLHDHIGQSLALTRMQLASVRKLASEPRQTAVLDEISDTLRLTVQQTRDLIYDLSPPQLNEIGLSAAIQEWLEEQVEKRHGIQTEFIDNGPEDLLDEDLRSILFRSVRELVTNVIKHSQATQMKISVNRAGDQLKIIVSDNGSGFDTSALSHSLTTEGGFGLFSIKERMADLGGAIEISSEPGQGAQVILSVPLEKEEKNE